MKRLIFSFLLLLFFSIQNVYSQSGWFSICSNFPNYARHFDFVNALTGFIICNEGKILKTTDGGFNWVELNPTLNFILYYVKFINQDTGYIGTHEGAILITTNQGNTFHSLNTGETSIIRFRFLNQSTGFAISYGPPGKLLKTTNSGFNWSLLYTNGAYGKISDMFLVDEQTLFLAASEFHPGFYEAEVKISTNGGYYFTNVFTTNLGFERINFISSMTGFVSQFFFYRSTDFGVNWISNPSANAVRGDVVKLSNGTIISGSVNGSSGNPTIYYSIDYGLNWDTAFINSLHRGNIEFIDFIDDNTGWALAQYYGTNGVLLKTTTGGVPIGFKTGSIELPNHFSLSQNYPNPFNPVTRIKYDIPANGKGQTANVKLIIYDMLGREIQTLVNENKKPGTYEVDWDGSRFASGVYFYRLVTDDFVETKKMVLIK